MRLLIKKLIVILTISLSFSWEGLSQSQFYSIKIAESGIFKLEEEDAKRLGANSLSDISFFGYPGMLPQPLQEEQLAKQEIPSFIQNGVLYIYLEGPHVFEKDSSFNWNYRHHLYADSLSYLIGVGSRTKDVSTLELPESISAPKPLYQLIPFKGEENNILNSGRTWYSEAILPQSSRTISVFKQAGNSERWKLFGTLMSSSSTPSSISILLDDQEGYEASFDAIPTTTYGIKGIEDQFSFEFSPKENRLDRIRTSFKSADQSATGYWDNICVGIPYSSQTLGPGIYYNWNAESVSLVKDPKLSYWDVSDFFRPQRLEFALNTEPKIDKLIVFNPEEVSALSQFKSISKQLSESNSSSELIIIAPKIFSFSAEKLKSHKIQIGIPTEVVWIEEIIDHFGYGNQDLTAIRNYIASRYHHSNSLKNVLLFGKGTFDYKGKLGGRPNLIPTYSSRNSLNPLTTYSSDDYFGMVEIGQGSWAESSEGDEMMQIGVGRLPVISKEEALVVVNKIIAYESSHEPGFWKKGISFLVDDGDNNIHMRDAEKHATYLEENHPFIQQKKLYLDSYEQVTEGTNQKSPQAISALEKTLEEGTLILNYIGHGNETSLTAEEVFTVADIRNWPKQKNLALWVTATCEFGRQDSPFFRSAAEELLIASDRGAIGILSTGRPVFSSVNFSVNEAFIQEAFQSNTSGYQDLGTIFKNTKNKSLKGPFNRNFSLIGDPSLKLAKPELAVDLISIEDKAGNTLNSLPSGQALILKSAIIDPVSGATQIGYHGNYQIEIWGGQSDKKSFGDENPPFSYTESEVVLFRGEGSVLNGELTTEIFIPRKLGEKEFSARIRIIAMENQSNFEAFGTESVLAKESNETVLDREGPSIQLLLNGVDPVSNSFPSTSLFAHIDLEDRSGIDISGLLPERQLSVEINGGAPLYLNREFIARNNRFESGYIEILLEGFVEGKNEILINAWDNLGNQSNLSVPFFVKGSEQLKILNHKTYPNPTNEVSNFILEHNRPGENFQITISIFQTTGQAIFTESLRLTKASARIDDLSWIFLQNQSKYPAKGTYIYKLTLQSETDNSTATVSGQIVIK
ncbi:type IX secretion system sortase PorU [Algoriphagus halophilus]|uniref:Por secretion system C-terminal sorting domain-containing protein n=1 Tax=Algoriphagus halophilus TaxID=226505 RepID=A0A1N6D7A2_9BACT|nr:type IX secretion system sortase PorU [Algoriphagus halophilus]SIN66692.1 Por secretion system C-terminal sorting domain-containing protein [Algoriphagus halophilus]